jgi:hypothetical protein
MTHSEAGRLGGRPRLKTIEELTRMQTPVKNDFEGGRLPGRLKELRILAKQRIAQITQAAG